MDMDPTIKEILVIAAVVAAVMFFFNIGDVRGHENGHADGIMEFYSGDRTGWIERSEWCWAGDKRQNKVVLSIDEDRDDIVEVCCTLWYEHGRPHYILSEPEPDGTCRCQGYVWLEGDSQGEEVWDFRDNYINNGRRR